MKPSDFKRNTVKLKKLENKIIKISDIKEIKRVLDVDFYYYNENLILKSLKQ